MDGILNDVFSSDLGSDAHSDSDSNDDFDDAHVEIVSCNTDSTSTQGSYSSADHVPVSCDETSDES